MNHEQQIAHQATVNELIAQRDAALNRAAQMAADLAVLSHRLDAANADLKTARAELLEKQNSKT